MYSILQCEDKADVYHKDLLNTKSQLFEADDNRTHLAQEAQQVIGGGGDVGGLYYGLEIYTVDNIKIIVLFS